MPSSLKSHFYHFPSLDTIPPLSIVLQTKKKKREGLGLYNTCMSPSFCFSCSRECAALRWGNVVLQLSTNIYIYISKHLFLYYIVHFLKKKVLITFTSDPVHSSAKKKKTEKTSKERERKPTVHRRKCSTTLRTDRTTELLDEYIKKGTSPPLSPPPSLRSAPKKKKLSHKHAQLLRSVAWREAPAAIAQYFFPSDFSLLPATYTELDTN